MFRPFADNLKTTSLSGDLLAALTVSVMIIPQGMAYAVLAGLPAIYGLYTAFVPLLIYPLLGTSKQLSVGPVALVSIIVLGGVSAWAEPGTERYIELALLTSLIAGLVQVIFSAFRLGFLVNFLSKPVIMAFTSAAAVIIILSQLKYIFGIDAPRGSTAISLTQGLLSTIQGIHWPSVILGAIAIAGILLLKRVHKKIPGSLLAIVLGTLAIVYWQWDDIAIVGAVPQGLPQPTVSFLNLSDVALVFPLALIICLISFIESLAIAQNLAQKHNYSIDANRELSGLGWAKVIGSFFLAFPNTGSFGRSAINDEAGARSGLASIFAAIIIAIILLFFTDLFYFLPQPVLAAVVIAAVLKLISIKYPQKIYTLDKKDFYVYVSTFLLTLLLGVQVGVLIGILFSILFLSYQSSRPHYAILGLLEGTDSYRSIERFPNALQSPNELIFRFDSDINFSNASYLEKTLAQEINKRPHLSYVIFNAASISNMDSTGVEAFIRIMDKLDEKNIQLLLTDVHGPIRDLFQRTGIMARIGYDHNYLNVADAVAGHNARDEASQLSRKYARQSEH